jgi:hypothetical protein
MKRIPKIKVFIASLAIVISVLLLLIIFNNSSPILLIIRSPSFIPIIIKRNLNYNSIQALFKLIP